MIPQEQKRKNIILIGMMGTGKTTVGRYIAQHTQYQLTDTDRNIEIEQGVPIKQIFGYAGEEFFRELETRELKKHHNALNIILATGGGIVLREQNRDLLKTIGTVFYLHSDIKLLYQRISQSHTRPLALTEEGPEKLKQMYQQRRHFYEETADVHIDVSQKNLYQIKTEIISQLPSEIQ